jgi:hypothetical protein
MSDPVAVKLTTCEQCAVLGRFEPPRTGFVEIVVVRVTLATATNPLRISRARAVPRRVPTSVARKGDQSLPGCRSMRQRLVFDQIRVSLFAASGLSADPAPAIRAGDMDKPAAAIAS